jgi:DNA-nicking Smr family endonuclease
MAAAIMSADESKRRSRRLSAEERQLWGDITRLVAPLRRQPVPTDPASPAPPGTKRLAHARGPAHAVAPAARSAPRLEPFDRRLKQRLARGTESIDARIDLHGKTQSAAHAALLSFLRRAQRDGAKFVLVITGKGGSARDDWSERGVLKRQVPQWLTLPEFRGYVVGFEDAHIGHGGAGALYVRIRRRKSGTGHSPDS